MNRRKFLTALGSLIAAPAIVRAASIMPVKRPPLVIDPGVLFEIGQYNGMVFIDNDIEFGDYDERMWVDWARNAMPVARYDA